jgi:Domain of unknown function (DUF1707)
MIEPGNEMARDGNRLVIYRDQVTRTLKAALTQGRLTEDEYDERIGQAAASRSPAELAALTADLPVGRMDAPARPPTGRDVRIGFGATIAAASVAAAILVWQPGNGLAFMLFVIAAVTVLVAPIVTAGLIIDVRRQQRSGGQLPHLYGSCGVSGVHRVASEFL